MPLQPRDEYYNIINSSDINLISLDERMKAPCILRKNNKSFCLRQTGYSNCCKKLSPACVIGSINKDLVIQPGNITALKNTIVRLKNDSALRNEMGNMQKHFFEDKMNLEGNVIAYEHIFKKIIPIPVQ